MFLHLIKIKKYYIVLLVFILFFSMSVQYAAAIDTGITKTAEIGYGGTPPNPDISLTIGKVVGAGLAFIGVIFLILMIYGGFVWMMARGNETEITKAKDLIYSAIIGLVIVLAAYAITALVGGIFGQTK